MGQTRLKLLLLWVPEEVSEGRIFYSHLIIWINYVVTSDLTIPKGAKYALT